jgi:ABC-2 type transport system ATP-binding protein
MTTTVEIVGASKWYGAVIGANEVTLDIGPGITGLLGPNGAGKSTLMKLIAGLLRPSLGEVRVLGRSVWGRPSARREVGYAGEVDGFFEEMSGRAFVLAMARLSGLGRRAAARKTEDVLAGVGMRDLAGKHLAACSKGMRQRIKIAQALVHEPSVIVLDEPLSGIDPVGREDLLRLFRSLGSRGKTIIVSTHIIEEIEAITEDIVLMARGRVLAAGTGGGIREILDESPFTIRIVVSRARRLAAALLAREEVTGIEIEADGNGMVVKARRPDALLGALPALVAEGGHEVESVEPLDASAEAVFGYLVGNRKE